MPRKKGKPAETRRVPFVLNLNDDVDAVIWAKLEPLLDLHRASAYIRAVLAKEILGQSVESTIAIGPSSNGHKSSLSAGINGRYELPYAKPVALPASTEMYEEGNDEDQLENAANNFLDMFG